MESLRRDVGHFWEKMSVGKIVGIWALLGGILWIKPWNLPFGGSVFDGNGGIDWLGLIFLMVTLPLLLLPGACAAYYGFRLIREVKRKYIARAIGWMAFMGAFRLLVLMDPISLSGVDKEVVRAVAESVLILVGIPVYLVSCKVIMRREGILIEGFHGLMQRATIFVFSLLFWFQLGELVRCIDEPKRLDSASESGWKAFGVLAAFLFTILIARGFYRILLKICGAEETEDQRHFRLGLDRNPGTVPKASDASGRND